MHPMSQFSICLLSILISVSVLAEQQTATKAQISLQKTQTKIFDLAVGEKKSNHELNVSLNGQAYFESSEEAEAAEQIYQLQHKYLYEKNNQKIQTHFIFGGYTKKQFFYGAVPELYYQVIQPDNSSKNPNLHVNQTYIIGRKIIESSRIDQMFNLGLMNPTLTQDFITYQQQGLTGFHQGIDSKMWGIQLGFLPLYLPNQGPSVKEINGKIEGSNRWVKKPPAQFAFNDSNKEIIYSVKYDEVSKLIFTPGALAQIRIGQMDQQLHLISTFSKRPMNEPILERETFADLDVVGKVNLIPNVIYDDLVTTDLRYQNTNFKMAASYISDRPENKTARSFYSIQNLQPIHGYSVVAEYKLPAYKTKSILVGFGIAEFSGGEITDINDDGSENIFTFSKNRLQYKKPLQFYVRADVFSVAGRMAQADIKWLYDREQKGTLLSTQIRVPALKALNANLGFDILGTQEQKTEDYGFLQQFQANDRVYGGLEYVF